MNDGQEQNLKSVAANGLGVAALVLGIIGLVFAFIPFLNYGSGVIPLVGLILGIVGLAKKGRKKTVAIIGTALSGAAIVLGIIMAIVYTAAFFGAVDKSVKQTNATNNTPVAVVYEVTGGSTDASVTYSTYANGQSGTEQATGQALPFSKTVTGTKGWSSYSLTAMNGMNDKGDITCKITVDGVVVSTQTSTGSFASAACSSTSTNASN